MLDQSYYSRHKLLVANRGEISIRILRTARKLGLRTVAIYTQEDATSPHVSIADEAIALFSVDPDASARNPQAYLDAELITRICIEREVTLVHPGYGFLSESASFAELLASNGITLLGPSPQVIRDMGLKHRARTLATAAGVPVVPGSEGLVFSIEEALRVSAEIRYPVMLKATAGGGGMGIVVCYEENDLKQKIVETQERALSLFHDSGIFIEKYFDSCRHIEVQIFGNGNGHVIHMGERECSMQRRHQKIIEEAPSPFLMDRPELRKEMCNAAVRLGSRLNYKSAGTVEFLVDDVNANFYFLEMNTRLQVEHGVTEMLYNNLDIVEMMIDQGILEGDSSLGVGLSSDVLNQSKFDQPPIPTHVIETRVYCENPSSSFSPSPGVLQSVTTPDSRSDIRIDTWISTGLSISSFYDPLIAKLIIRGNSRKASIDKLISVLSGEGDIQNDRLSIKGPPNNIPFLLQVLGEKVFQDGKATTSWVDSAGVKYTPSAFTVLSPGLNTSVQSLPVRSTGLGVPPSGPMDWLAFQAANIICGNPQYCEGLELVITPGGGNNLIFKALFHVSAVLSVTGSPTFVSIDGLEVSMWTKLVVPAGSKLIVGGSLQSGEVKSQGLRAYIAVRGGFPDIPEYLGSKSTTLGAGGYQGRCLYANDQISISSSTLNHNESTVYLTSGLVPIYPSSWIFHSLPGPHDDTEFLTSAGIESFYSRKWRVSTASNRMGIRLESTADDDETPHESVLEWSRSNGGEGGSHPSNILDNGYAFGSVNLNGDTPVILTVEGPNMGGYLSIATVASADQWKFGQVRPGDTIQFKRISFDDSLKLEEHVDKWLESIFAFSQGFNASPINLFNFSSGPPETRNPVLYNIPASGKRPKIVFRQAGDAAILVEFGEMTLDFTIRARIHAFETELRKSNIPGIRELAPCIRSTMVYYDHSEISQDDSLKSLIHAAESIPESIEDMSFPGRLLSFPIVLDDRWNKEALERYMTSTRDKAVYLPSNVDYLATNNGIEGGSKEVLKLLTSSPWLVFGVGFYLACPFLVPIDPRCRLVAQKMNPSRTYTPRGAVGIAGLVAAIYPVESPGGYQLFGRTLPAWSPWGKGENFSSDKPWLLEPFDQVVFEPVTEEEYMKMEKEFDNGRYKFKIEPSTFSVKQYLEFISSVETEIAMFKQGQLAGVKREEERETQLIREWQEGQSRKEKMSADGAYNSAITAKYITAAISGVIWQIKVNVGDTITSEDQIILILEAMKTEIPIRAGDENIGLKIAGFGKGVKQGQLIMAGEPLVFFNEG